MKASKITNINPMVNHFLSRKKAPYQNNNMKDTIFARKSHLNQLFMKANNNNVAVGKCSKSQVCETKLLWKSTKYLFFPK